MAPELMQAVKGMKGFEDHPNFVFEVMAMLTVYDVKTNLRGAAVNSIVYDDVGLVGLEIEGNTEIKAVVIQPADKDLPFGKVSVVEKDNFHECSLGKRGVVNFWRNLTPDDFKQRTSMFGMLKELGTDTDGLNFNTIE